MTNGTPGRPLGEIIHRPEQSQREQLDALGREIDELKTLIFGHLEVCPVAGHHASPRIEP